MNLLKNSAAAVVFLLFIVAESSAATGNWKAEPTAFGGVVLGAPIQDVERDLGVKCKQVVIRTRSFAEKPVTPMYSHECVTQLEIGDVGTFPFTLYIKDGVLALVELQLSAALYERIRDAFAAKYGPPTRTSRSVVSSDVDAAQRRPPKQNEGVSWSGTRVTISLSKYVETVTWAEGESGPIKTVEPGSLRVVYKTDKDITEDAKK